jgi:hypothetical protein
MQQHTLARCIHELTMKVLPEDVPWSRLYTIDVLARSGLSWRAQGAQGAQEPKQPDHPEHFPPITNLDVTSGLV